MSLPLGEVCAFGLAAQRVGQERRRFAVGLVVALVYVGFAVGGGASLEWTRVEIVGLWTYGGLAWAGWRVFARWLALGWALHPPRDLGLHLVDDGGAFVPAGYAWLCLSVDLGIATASGRLAGESPRTAAR